MVRAASSAAAHRVPPDHAGATRVMAGAAIAPRVVEQRVVGFHLTAGQALFADKLLERRCLKHPPGEEQTADDRRPVGFPRQIARVGFRHIAGTVRHSLDIAARPSS